MDARSVDESSSLCARPPPDDARDARVAVDHDAGRNHEEHQRLEGEVDLALQRSRVSDTPAFIREYVVRAVCREVALLRLM